MTIVTMTATFGRLNGETLALTPGLNLLEKPNESGKSTWCAFVRAMFYGLEGRKGGPLSERNLYTPWSGAPMDGVMELRRQGESITLHRFPKGSNPFGGFEAFYTGTRTPVPGLTGDNAGEVLLGVSKEVFERTAFIGQGGMAMSRSGDLEKRVAALATSGEEDVSFSQTEATLREWRNARRSVRSTGEIPKLQSELEEVSAQRSRAEAARTRAGEAQDALDALLAEKAEVEADLARHTAADALAYKARYDQAKAALDEALAREAALEAEQPQSAPLPSQEALRAAQGEVAYLGALDKRRRALRDQLAQELGQAKEVAQAADDPRYAGRTGPEAVEEARVLTRQLTEKTRPPLWMFLPFAATAVTWVVLLALGILKVLDVNVSAPAGSFLMIGGFMVSSLLLQRDKAKKRRTQEAVLDRFKVKEVADLLPAAQRYEDDQRARQKAEEAHAATSRELDKLEGEYLALWSRLSSFVAPFAPDVDSPAALSAALSRALTVDDKRARVRQEAEAARRVFAAASAQGQPGTVVPDGQPPRQSLEEDRSRLQRVESSLALYRDMLAQEQGKLQSLGDAAQWQDQEATLTGRLRQLEEEYDALTLAMDGLTAANAKLQSRFSPEVNRVAGEYLQRLTGGKYHGLSFDRDFQAAAEGENGVRAAHFLSQGTADQIYLALRLAVCRLALPQEDPAPLILDDALVTFDQPRLENALHLLEDLAQDHQLLLFTCQDREGRALSR